MSYLVLARKWRPRVFSELVGQQHVVRTFSNAIASGRVHHAFLFTGSRGVGKTSAARILAKALNCEQGPTPTPCGQCAACTEITAGSATDVIEIDGASNTGVDNIRELRENVRYLPARCRFKVYIIDEVHMLTTAAFNALLKTLEEPPAHVKFVLATTEPQKIPITILSRCQRFDFRRVSLPEIVGRLAEIVAAEGVSADDGALRVIAREAQGSMRDAQSLLEQAVAFAGRELDEAKVIEAIGVVDRHFVALTAQALIGRDLPAALDAARQVHAKGHDLVDFTTLVSEYLRDLAVLKAGAPTELIERSPAELATLGELAERVSLLDLQRLFGLVSETARDLRQAPLPRLVLDMGLLRACAVTPTRDLTAIVDELRGLLGGAAPHVPGPGAASASSAQAQLQEAPRVRAPGPTPAGQSRSDPFDRERRPPAPTNLPPRTTPEASAAPAPRQPPAPLASVAPVPATLAPAPPSVLAPAPTATGPAAPASSLPAGEPSWEAFVNATARQAPPLAAVLEHARVAQFSAQGIALGFGANDFYPSYLAAPDHQRKVEELAALFFGVRHVPLKILKDLRGVTTAPSLADGKDRKRQDEVRALREEAVSDPRVKKAVEILGGSVKDVRPVSGN